MPRRRDSRSRTPPRPHPRSHHRSQDFSSGRATRHRSRTRPPRVSGSSNKMPRTWQQTAHEWDSNRVYGLTLPKIVVSNRLTQQGISGMNIVDVPLRKVISGGVNNWAFEAGGPLSDGAVGKLSLETRSDFLWSVDASIALGSGGTGWYGFCYRIECFT